MLSVRSYPSHRNMWGDVLVQKPGKQLARSIRGVGRKPSGLESEGRFSPIDHGPSCRNLVIGACRRRLDIEDDCVLDINI